MWPQQDYQRFAKAQLEVCGRATFARAYWTLKNMNNDWSQEKMINNVTSGWDFDKEHPVQWKKKKKKRKDAVQPLTVVVWVFFFNFDPQILFIIY